MAGSRQQQTGKGPAKNTLKKADRSVLAGRVSGLFRNHQQVAVDSLDRLLSTLTSSLMTWAMIAIAIALPLSLLLLLQNLQQFGSDLDEAGQISVFLDINISAERSESCRVNSSNVQTYSAPG